VSRNSSASILSNAWIVTIVLGAAAARSACSGSGPAPPAPRAVETGGQPAPARFVTGQGDTLLIEADTLADYALSRSSPIDPDPMRNRIVLADGTTLTLDDRTPEGTYVLPDGSTLSLGPPQPYPRYASYAPRPDRSLFFAIRSTACVAALVDSEIGQAMRLESVEDSLRARLEPGRRWPAVIHRAPVAFEFPRDWYRRASIDFDRSLEGPYRITWIAYGRAGPSSEEIRKSLEEKYGPGFHPVPEGAIQPPPLPNDELLHRTARIVGQLTVYPRAGRVIAVPEGASRH